MRLRCQRMLTVLYKSSHLRSDWSKKVNLMAYIFRLDFFSHFKYPYSFQLLIKTWLWRLKKILSETRKNLQCQTMSSNQKHLIQKIFILILYNGLCDHTRPFGFQKLKFPSKSNLLLTNFGIIDEKWKTSQLFGQNFGTFQ